jgi:hypothetical protein
MNRSVAAGPCFVECLVPMVHGWAWTHGRPAMDSSMARFGGPATHAPESRLHTRHAARTPDYTLASDDAVSRRVSGAVGAGAP